MAGPINKVSMAFVADAATQENLVAVQGAADGSVKLPAGNYADGIVGIIREARAAGQFVSVLLDGIEYVKASGTCTRGQKAVVMADGGVQNAPATGTPTQYPFLGQFLESGSSSNLVLVQISKGYVTQ